MGQMAKTVEKQKACSSCRTGFLQCALVAYAPGITTVSITWITPLLWNTSV